MAVSETETKTQKDDDLELGGNESMVCLININQNEEQLTEEF